ncbi:oxidoreductase [Helicobacter ailurogastricus]|uniref:NADPH dehydrogenase (Xenobiotic reductase) n=1 Tax=Helicobacter ailurogastricus TaxID=1578720 RepID=A0A0K2Y0X1_9HELI|nr:NADPH dehydrogenase [Helicobacter ailurogastricus]BDQ28415.1 NADPH dehydrogenase [Helicobacter ailurogastricus]CRF52951.1 NADPH dehydrogenase (Xenobiotic reductase) [Helicobacter ailurogastricus]
MDKTLLFSPWKIKDLELKNRVVMAPMDQYSARDGHVNDWHTYHYVSRAIGQVGLIIFEVAAVSANGRISSEDLGIYEDKHIEGLAKIVKECHKYGSKVALQIGHAGRKGQLKDTQLLAPSALRFNESYATPKEMDTNDIKQVILEFKQAGLRAKQAGFDALEIHAAHGYLLSSFLSPLSNHRNDAYGKNRALILQEILESLRETIDLPLTVRVSAADYHKQGNTPEKIAQLLEPLDSLYDALNVSSGGVVEVPIKVYPGYQISSAGYLRDALGKPTIGGGALEEPKMAQRLVGSQVVDAIYLARALLKNPFWCFNAALSLGQEIEIPKPYARMVYL